MSNKTVQELLETAKNLIEAANSLVSANEPDERTKSEHYVQPSEVEESYKRVDLEDEFRVKTIESKTPVWRGNKFEEMGDLDVEKPEGYDAIKDDIKPAKRNRKAYTTVDIECKSCNKKVSINPIFKKEIFVCDKCIGKRAGRGA